MGFVPGSKSEEEPENYEPKPGNLVYCYMRGVSQPVFFNGVQVVQRETSKGTYGPPISVDTSVVIRK